MYKYIEKWNRKTPLKIACVSIFASNDINSLARIQRKWMERSGLLDDIHNEGNYWIWIWVKFVIIIEFLKDFWTVQPSPLLHHFSQHRNLNKRLKTPKMKTLFSFTSINCVKSTKTESINKSVCYRYTDISRILFSAQL